MAPDPTQVQTTATTHESIRENSDTVRAIEADQVNNAIAATAGLGNAIRGAFGVEPQEPQEVTSAPTTAEAVVSQPTESTRNEAPASNVIDMAAKRAELRPQTTVSSSGHPVDTYNRVMEDATANAGDGPLEALSVEEIQAQVTAALDEAA